MNNDTYYGNINPTLLEIIPQKALRIIEFGCGSGTLLEALRAQNRNREFLGFEVQKKEADKSRALGFEIITGNIENMNLETELSTRGWTGSNKPDCIIFGDVLEHLYNPWRMLRKLHELLDKNGHLAICIPNIQHWSVIQEIISGHFHYQDSGILDRTHLRFFTRSTATQMILKSGFDIITTKGRLWENDGAEEFLEKLSPLLSKEQDRLEFLSGQYVFLARPR